MPARISTAATAASSAHHHGPPRKYSNEDAPAYPWQKLVSHERQAQMRKLNEWKRRNSELMRYSKPCKVMMVLLLLLMMMMMMMATTMTMTDGDDVDDDEAPHVESARERKSLL
jgi:hypothetical protein